MKTTEEKEVDLRSANIRALVKTRPGRELVWEVLGMCDLNTPGASKYQAGKRQVGLDLLQILEDADPTIYPNLILENIKNGN